MDAVAIRAVLARTPRLNGGHVQALLAAAGGDITRTLEPHTVARVELPPEARSFLILPDEAALQADCEWISAAGAQLVASTDAGYPSLLLRLPDCPAMLFVLGNIHSLSRAQVAMVGSRSPTPAGRKTALDFAASFALAGLTITSGLATGIDAASHEGALLGGGQTVAVCGTGLDQVYPTQHAGLAARIRGNGALVSEFPPRTPPAKLNFPRRNRLISALSLGTLVVEAAQHSGSLATARRAREQGREVFAVPGSIYNPLSRGCHKLIREGASLVESPSQVLAKLEIPHIDEALVRRKGRRRGQPALDKGYEMLLDAVGFEAATLDEIVARTDLPGEAVASMLLILELEGRIAPYPGGRFGRIP
jgi:DNA processing protein